MADSSNEINYNAWSDRRAKNKPQRQREENVEEPYSTITSNLDSFLVCTTPMVQRQFTPQASSMAERWKIMDSQCISFFSLADLWDAYDEWSAYGAGVPLYLPTEQVVVQYYVPYLSALQIYARDSSDFCFTRKFGEESDFSDLNSEASIDMGRTDTIWDASTQSSEDSDEAFYQKRNNHGQLLFEYFERISPCGRAPLADKISELSHQFSKLKSLRSHELSPASWVSVAWYPIYRIPTGVTMKDMEACFLTFHSLSTAACLQGGVWDELESSGRDAQNPVRVEEEKMMLPVFGLASYKLRGAAWSSLPQSERRRAWSLMSCADAWLKQLHVHHPDFHFFASSTRRPK